MPNDEWKRMMDQWLSPEPGKGPPEDDAWRQKTRAGGFLTPFGAPQAKAGAATRPEGGTAAAAGEETFGHGLEDDSAWFANPDDYETERETFARTFAAFRQRLMYAFPNVQALDAEQLTLAASWLTDAEVVALEARERAQLFKVYGYQTFFDEAEAALHELAQLKQLFTAQRNRVERERREQIATINRERDAYVAKMHEKRRKIWQDTQDEINEMREESRRKAEILREKQHREFLRYIRGEQVIGYIKLVDD